MPILYYSGTFILRTNLFETRDSAQVKLPIREINEAKDSGLDLDPMVIAIQLFQTWLLDLQRRKLALVESPDSRILHINQEVTKRFCVGTAEDHIFLGIPTEEMSWFQNLPWLHVALKRGSSRINLVSEQTTIQNVTAPYFALALHVDNSQKISILLKNKNLHIREVSVDEHGVVNGVSKKVCFTITIICVDEDSNVASLLGKRGGRSFTNRSVFRGIGK